MCISKNEVLDRMVCVEDLFFRRDMRRWHVVSVKTIGDDREKGAGRKSACGITRMNSRKINGKSQNDDSGRNGMVMAGVTIAWPLMHTRRLDILNGRSCWPTVNPTVKLADVSLAI